MIISDCRDNQMKKVTVLDITQIWYINYVFLVFENLGSENGNTTSHFGRTNYISWSVLDIYAPIEQCPHS